MAASSPSTFISRVEGEDADPVRLPASFSQGRKKKKKKQKERKSDLHLLLNRVSQAPVSGWLKVRLLLRASSLSSHGSSVSVVAPATWSLDSPE